MLKKIDLNILEDFMSDDGEAHALLDGSSELVLRKSHSGSELLFVTISRGKQKKCDFVSCHGKSPASAIADAVQVAEFMYDRF